MNAANAPIRLSEIVFPDGARPPAAPLPLVRGTGERVVSRVSSAARALRAASSAGDDAIREAREAGGLAAAASAEAGRIGEILTRVGTLVEQLEGAISRGEARLGALLEAHGRSPE